MDYIKDYRTERNKTGSNITYQEYLENRLTDEIEKVKQLTEYNYDPKCFHECPNCNMRCNCNDNPCSHCLENEI
jgi:hypothetical protein